MAHWINQTLHVNQEAEILLMEYRVIIQTAGNQGWDGAAVFSPINRDDAFAQAIALRLAAKRLEEIGKAMPETSEKGV